MSVFKCKMCGGTIEFNKGDSVGVCDSCGTRQTLPRIDDDMRANLYDRANHFRRNNDYDKAMAIYERILNEDSTDAEAYWSLVLCRYGIEYVEDPASHKRVPTVNRTQFKSVYMDEDYKSALKYADGYQRKIYEEEAAAIDEIQKKILEISDKEEPFDVFICYKETDSSGRRTQDSVLANDLYHQLTQEGFKVFFSRITLEDKLGTAYEPYIFAALNSAKAMVVIGTRPEYFNAVWVRNEWSRYLSLISSGARKTLIPAYRDMDPYDLPEEFSHLQAQDMSKLGFMQDLIRGIRKIVSTDAPQPTAKGTPAADQGQGNTASLLKRAFLFLEDGDFKEANEYCDRVLDMEPECAEAYLGKLMAQWEVRRQEELAECGSSFENNKNYHKILRFGDEKLITTLKGYIEEINERIENKRVESVYLNALNEIKQADNKVKDMIENKSRTTVYVRLKNIDKVCSIYESAADAFGSIIGYMDSESLQKQCLNKVTECQNEKVYITATNKMTGKKLANYEEALKAFKSISGHKDIEKKIYECQNRIDKIRKKHKNIKSTIIIIGISIVVLAIGIQIANFAKLHFAYSDAISQMDDGNITEAYEKLISLHGYKDKASGIFDQYKKEKLKSISKGDSFYFGSYEQDNRKSNGKEPIEWQVLEKKGSKVLLLSKYGIDIQPYNHEDDDVTWGVKWNECSLRKWLNREFVKNTFSSSDRAMIRTTFVSPDKNPEYNDSEYYDSDPGKGTKDKVFLLSTKEAMRYFGNKSVIDFNTEYAKARAKEQYGEDELSWWLRTPGRENDHAAVYQNDNDGWYIDYSGKFICSYAAVRPALWVDLD